MLIYRTNQLMSSIYSILAAQKYRWSYYGTVNDSGLMLSFSYPAGPKKSQCPTVWIDR
jgi:hypothetical protein